MDKGSEIINFYTTRIIYKKRHLIFLNIILKR